MRYKIATEDGRIKTKEDKNVFYQNFGGDKILTAHANFCDFDDFSPKYPVDGGIVQVRPNTNVVWMEA